MTIKKECDWTICMFDKLMKAKERSAFDPIFIQFFL